MPTVWPLFWAFRIMVALGFGFIAMMAYFFYRASFKGMNFPRPALKVAVWIIPPPWIAAELGWFVAEFGRQPWTVDGVLPTAMSVVGAVDDRGGDHAGRALSSSTRCCSSSRWG